MKELAPADNMAELGSEASPCQASKASIRPPSQAPSAPSWGFAEGPAPGGPGRGLQVSCPQVLFSANLLSFAQPEVGQAGKRSVLRGLLAPGVPSMPAQMQCCGHRVGLSGPVFSAPEGWG